MHGCAAARVVEDICDVSSAALPLSIDLKDAKYKLGELNDTACGRLEWEASAMLPTIKIVPVRPDMRCIVVTGSSPVRSDWCRRRLSTA